MANRRRVSTLEARVEMSGSLPPLTFEERQTMDDVREIMVRPIFPEEDTSAELQMQAEAREQLQNVADVINEPPKSWETLAFEQLKAMGSCTCRSCVGDRVANLRRDQIQESIQTPTVPDPILHSKRTRRNSYVRMGEACPIISQLLILELPTRAMDAVRIAIENRILSQVTSKFRNALNDCVEELEQTQDAYVKLKEENLRLHLALERSNGKT